MAHQAPASLQHPAGAWREMGKGQQLTGVIPGKTGAAEATALQTAPEMMETQPGERARERGAEGSALQGLKAGMRAGRDPWES